MKAPAIFNAFVFLSGWAVAALLLIARPLEPIKPAQNLARRASLPPPDSSDDAFEAFFRGWSANPALAGALVGFCVLDGNGATLFASPLAETALCPASALKTLTTAAALELLGDNFQFESVLHSSAEVGADGVLDGDLIFTGGGDPTLSSDDLERFVTAVVAKNGLKRVLGSLMVDASCFTSPPVSDHWNWGDIGNAYGAGAFGVNVDHNRMILRFVPGQKPGDPAKLLDAKPANPQPEWDHQVLTGPAGSGDRVMVYSAPYGRRVTLRGTVPAGEKIFQVNAAIPDPPALVEEILRSRMKSLGVVFEGRSYPEESRNRANSKFQVAHFSAKLPEIIDHLHRVSDNLEAQCLFLTMGLESSEDAAEVVRRHWESRGVAFTGLRLIDGSGLARANMIRPVDLARVNLAARRGPHGDRFRQSLTAYSDGKARSKFGAMSGVRTEVGFLTLPGGRELAFALMANGLAPDVDFWKVREPLLDAAMHFPGVE